MSWISRSLLNSLCLLYRCQLMLHQQKGSQLQQEYSISSTSFFFHNQMQKMPRLTLSTRNPAMKSILGHCSWVESRKYCLFFPGYISLSESPVYSAGTLWPSLFLICSFGAVVTITTSGGVVYFQEEYLEKNHVQP